jgi:hypothetical protein
MMGEPLLGAVAFPNSPRGELPWHERPPAQVCGRRLYAKLLVVGPRLCNLLCSSERAANFVDVKRIYGVSVHCPGNMTADANSKSMLTSWLARAMSPRE